MADRGMNERIRRLRRISTTTPAHIDLERAKIETDFYRENEGKYSTPVMRAMVLKEYFSRKTLYLGDDELIVGEKGKDPQASPTFPEICTHTVEDMKIMDARDLVSFKVTDEDIALQEKEIIPFWKGKSTREKLLARMTDEWKTAYAAGMFTEFMEQRGPGHTCGGDRIWTHGYLDYKQEIQDAIDRLDYMNDPEALDKFEELTAMSIDCDAICILGERYHKLALEKAAEEKDPQRKKELEQIAANCAVVPAHKPQTYWQALQAYWFTHLAVTTELNPWDAFSPGRLDQHLFPFYEADTEAGILDDEHALELLECLWVKFYNQPAPVKVGVTLKESGTYTDFANINTGGITPEGKNGVNAVSYLILDCMDEMQLVQPNSNVQISKKTPQKFLKRACEISRKGWGQPAFYNTDELVQELMNAGKTVDDARCGGSSGCVETGCWGKEAYILTGYLNIPKIFQLTLYDGYDTCTEQQLGLHTGNAQDFQTFEELWNAFEKQMKYFVDMKIRGNNVIEKIFAEELPAPFLSIVTDDCIQNGKDYNAGGARYNTRYIQGVGIGTVTDCAAAIKYNVFDQKKFTMAELLKAMEADFQGFDDIYSMVHDKSPKYGNDDDYADDIMKEIFDLYHDTITGRPTVCGGTYHIDMLPTTCHVYFGDVILATPNGRKAHKPVSEGISPEKSADVNGPTAVIKSCAKMDHIATGGTLLNQKFTPGVVAGEAGLDNMANLIRSYFAMDGHHIQFNVVDRQTLLDAQAHPEEYQDLIVRVAGYSDYFKNLDKQLQDEIIERTEQSFE
ncbi:formate C-acetyltransferase [Eubacterium pyruvativorans]|uniref:Formate C-acetyltransferase n=1 Tax=Eubacterium pyruvativorans TaxID=155865 RepID=A0A1I7HA20_9FIRM|nr:trans-4-hydroxy-L-proline dehydratase [Eubacterium pyruvativorans]MDO5568080.1 glycyl radical protein [Eubacteriales bacterium]HAT83238.1 glycyl radical protein [Eubacterium sp.]MCI5746416.1 glycyl radical protein [Eubacterium pyruvativorans]MDD6707354.1 glycyl radical protein [Eubacterium pyruvativorans]MDY4050170.1 trans-4-hydroxy-L-proline dehydratase [Eubacterium pyruvativorans]